MVVWAVLMYPCAKPATITLPTAWLATLKVSTVLLGFITGVTFAFTLAFTPLL
jgi:hypothetical protein